MSVDAKKVTAGKPKVGGAVFKAPIGTPLPTSAVSELDSAFVDAGYISEDGVSNDTSRESTEVKAWGGDTVLNTQSSKTDKYKMTFIEAINVETLKVVHGERNVSGDLTNGIMVRENSEELDHYAWVIDMVFNGDTICRHVIPDVQVTEMAEIVYKDDSPVGYEATMVAYPSTSIDGDTHREYIQKSPSSGGLGALTVASAAGSTSGKTAITVTPAKASGNVYKYTVASTETSVTYDMDVTGWTTWNGSAEIEADSGTVITVVEATADYKARKAGYATVVAASA